MCFPFPHFQHPPFELKIGSVVTPALRTSMPILVICECQPIRDRQTDGVTDRRMGKTCNVAY